MHPSEVTVRRYKYGAALFGTLPLDEIDAWIEWAKKLEYDFVDAWAAGHLNACMAFSSKKNGDLFRKEVGLDPNNPPGDGVTLSIGMPVAETIGERVARHLVMEEVVEQVNEGALDEDGLKVTAKRRVP